MTVLFAGGRTDSLTVVAGTITESTTAGSFDPTYCDASTVISDSSTMAAIQVDSSNTPVSIVSGETGWYHFEWYVQTTNTGAAIASLQDSSGFAWVAIRAPATGSNTDFVYNSGTGSSPVWTKIGSSLGTTNGIRYTIDIKVTIGSPHTAECYLNGVLVASTTFTQAGLTNLRRLFFTGGGSSSTQRHSQILITKNKSTIGAKVRYLRPNGAGGNTGWTGAFTNVNEAVNSDASFDNTAAAGNRQTYTMTDVTVPATYSIAGVFHAIRGRNDGTAPKNIKSVVRQGTTNYDYSTNFSGIGAGFGPLIVRYDTDPSTSAAWTQSGVNSAEFGYLSVT